LERKLAQDFRVESAGILARSADDAELYFIQQHYRMPTRLLDWTAHPLAGLYFAVKDHDTTDGALFMMDAFGLAETQNAEGFRGLATSRHRFFKDSMQRIYLGVGWGDPFCFPTFILPLRPDHFDRRMILQRSCFTFHVPDHGTLTKNENRTLRSFCIPAKAKADLRRQLFLLGVDEFSIYGDLESLSKRLKDAYNVP
jgi:hypothetical protein